MRILLSPAKKMRVDTDSLAPLGLPVYLEQARELMHAVQSLSLAEAKALWKCNDQLAELNYERFAHMDLERQLTPAVLAYEGLAYQYMAPGRHDGGYAFLFTGASADPLRLLWRAATLRRGGALPAGNAGEAFRGAAHS